MARLLVVTENYPQLKSDQNFRDLQAQLEGTENRITVARNRYIQAVQVYNIAVRQFRRPDGENVRLQGKAVISRWRTRQRSRAAGRGILRAQGAGIGSLRMMRPACGDPACAVVAGTALLARADVVTVPALTPRVTDLTGTLDAQQPYNRLESELAAFEAQKGARSPC